MTYTYSARESSVASRQAVIATTVTELIQNVGDIPDPKILYHLEPVEPIVPLPLSQPISLVEELRLL